MCAVDRDTRLGKPQVALVAALLLAALAARLLIAGRAIWFDEHFTLMHTESVAAAVDYSYKDVHPPLYFVLVAVWRTVLPSSEFSLRLLSLVFGMASLVGIFLAGRSVGGWKTGVAALSIAALSPYHWLYSTELRPYAMLMAFSAFSVWAFFSLLAGGELKWYVVLAVSTILNLYAHYFALFLLLAQVAVFLIVLLANRVRGLRPGGNLRRHALYGLLALGIVAVAYAPWAGVMRRIIVESVLRDQVVGVGSRVGRGVTLDLVKSALFQSMGWAVIPFVAQAAFAGLGLADRSSRIASLLFVASWTLPFLLMTAWRPAHFVAPKYFLFAYPATVVLVAAGLGAAERHLRTRWTRTAIAAPLLVLAVSVCPLLPGQHPPYAFHRADWRDIVRETDGYIKDGDRIGFPDDSKSCRVFMDYVDKDYFVRHPLLIWRETDIQGQFVPFASGTDIWLLKAGELPRRLASGLGEGLVRVKTWQVYPAGVTLYHWVPGRTIREVPPDSAR